MNKFMPLIVLGSALTAGCAIVTYKNAPIHVWTQYPDSGEVLTIKKGQALLRRSFVLQANGIEFPQGVSLKGYTLTGGKYLQIKQSELGVVYKPSNNFDRGGQVVQWGFYEPAQALLIDSQNRLCVQSAGATRCTTDHNAIPTKIETVTKKSHQQILQFESVDDSKIQLSYREYDGLSKQPSIKDELEIDLNKTQYIQYKGARIQIIEAGNLQIQYKVLSSFNKAQ